MRYNENLGCGGGGMKLDYDDAPRRAALCAATAWKMAAAALDHARYAANKPENVASGLANARCSAGHAKTASNQADRFAAGGNRYALQAADSADEARTLAEAAAEAAENLA
jgi:hypothetical protein